ncbi:MAG: efflux RND transporter periplasmic adaptor subunit [Coriobacteriia bacterium]
MAKEKRKRPPAIAIVIVLLVAAGVGGYFWWKSSQTASGGALAASGTVQAKEYQVAPAMAGRVATVTVSEGDAVKKGDVLVQLDDTALQLQLQQAQAGVKVAQAALDAAEDSGTDADVDAAKARLEQAGIAVELAQVQLGYATVTAPSDGVIVTVATNAGQNASAGKTLVTLSDASTLYVSVYVSETRIGDVNIGQSVSAKTDSSSKAFSGKVTFIASEAEFTPNEVQTQEQRTKLVYEVRANITDSTGTLKAGMPVDVTFE